MEENTAKSFIDKYKWRTTKPHCSLLDIFFQATQHADIFFQATQKIQHSIFQATQHYPVFPHISAAR